jgi:PAS domain S-box-containing protein
MQIQCDVGFMTTRVFPAAEDCDYELEPLREWADFILYRGSERRGQIPILAVAITAERPSTRSLGRLEHEFSLAGELDPAWAAQPLILTRHRGRALLVLRDPGGEPLDRVIEQHKGEPFDLTRALTIAVGLAAALGHVHRQGLIHRDLKPANAFVDQAGRVWLTGFGIASQLPRERQASEPSDLVAGTLEYMSPEQTGRMNRSMDTRSDLYSLGVVLYQMLTGSLPFAAADPLEWVHCHIARQPVAPAQRRALPEPISAITMRLLAKNAEERYQTAAGLEADLRRCLADWQSHRRIDPFPLGREDLSDRLLVPEKLYGREREVDALLAAFDRVVTQGTSELVLISGYSGVGKSSVVNELHKVLVPPRGIFASGKFDQYKRDVPYVTLAQAFQILMRQILVKSEAEVLKWRDTLLEALGPNGQLMIDLIPEVEFVIGAQSPVAELPAQEARARFHRVFRRFLGAFAQPEHPLALFLDDLQWLDSATLELLEHLVTDPDVRHVLLIGAYRDNEVSPSHPLRRTLAAIRGAGTKTQEIVLASLGPKDVCRLIFDSLHCEWEAADSLAQLIHGKTGGNPFFAIRFLTTLAEESLLRFDRQASGWTWDLPRIRAKGYSDNVVDLMVARLRRLSDTTQAALRNLACLGNVAGIATLGMICRQSAEEIHASLLEAVRTELILRLEGSYAFLHDRIQEAAYALIPESERAEAHLRIGRLRLPSLTQEGGSEHLFDIASQLNRGTALLTDHDEKVQVAAINLRAGRKAKASAAYASAREYFAAGMALLDERDWGNAYELTFGLWLERAECELLTGALDTAGQQIEQLLPRAASQIDEAAAYDLKVRLQTLKSEPRDAVATALTCLRRLGIDMPAHATQEQVQAEYAAVWQILEGRSIESLIDLPLMTDPVLQAAVQLLSEVAAPAYFIDATLFCLVIIRMVRVSLQHGLSLPSAHSIASWGFLLCAAFHRYGDGYRFAKLACDLVAKHGYVAAEAKVYGTAAMVASWAQPLTDAIVFARKGALTAVEAGDTVFACYSRFTHIALLLTRNDPLDEVWRESEMALGYARKVKFDDTADIIVSQQRFIATMQGRTANFSTFSDVQFDEATFEARMTGDRNPMTLSWYWIVKLKARFLSGNYAEALAADDNAKPVLAATAGLIQRLDYFYYAALTVSALYDAAEADRQQAWRELLTGHLEQLREWAESYPPTFAHKHALVSAEIARLEGRDADALQLYEQAIRLARENGFVQNEGLAHELAAQYCLARQLETAGYAHLRNARNCYERWGAHGKVKQLDERYPRLREERTPTSSASSGASVGQLDVETVVRASQALSSEMALPMLIEKLVRIAVEHAGAQRGLLILIRDGEPRIEVDATTSLGKIKVVVREEPVTSSELPLSALLYVMRTRESVLLDDALADSVYSQDDYVAQKRSRSILCLPILKQAKLVGALYLENNLGPFVFTPDRVAVLELLASQAAISLENASLYADLQLQAGMLQRLPVSAWTLRPDGTPDFVNQVWLDYSGQTQAFVLSHSEAWMSAVHPEDRDAVATGFWNGVRSGQGFSIEGRNLRAKDGTYRWHLLQAVVLRDAEGKVLKFIGTSTDIDDQKRSEEKLRESEHEARLTLDSIPGVVALLSPTGNMEMVSRQAMEFFGRTFEELRAWGTNDTVHPEELPGVIDTFTRALATGLPYEITGRFRRADGVYRWSQNRGCAIRDRNGEIARWCSLITDIDDQKRAEEALRESEHEARLTLDTIPGLVAVLSPTGSVEKVGRQALEYFGRTLEELAAWGTSDTIHPEDLPGVIDAFTRALATGHPYEFSARFRRADGVYRWFQDRGCPLRDRNGDIVRWYTLITDIDDRKRAEEALRESAHESALIVDSIPGLIVALNVKGELERVNQPCLDYVGKSQEELSQWAVDDTLHPEDRPAYLQALERSIAAGAPLEYEIRVRRFDGVYRWFNVSWLSLRDRQGHIVRWYVLLTDVDDRKRAEEALRQAQEDLARINRVTTMGELAASLAHELGQPISASLTNADAGLLRLGSDNPDLDGARAALKRILRDSQRAAAILGRIRSQFVRGALNRESIDINELSRETIALLRDEAMRQNVLFKTQLAADLPHIVGDRVQLQQVALNLIVNSIEAMEGVDGLREILVKSHRAEDLHVHISVIDTGAGFASELAEKIFDPFFTTKPQGTGMGLRICRSIIESHGGRLWAVGAPGHGATFHMMLPTAGEVG